MSFLEKSVLTSGVYPTSLSDLCVGPLGSHLVSFPPRVLLKPHLGFSSSS